MLGPRSKMSDAECVGWQDIAERISAAWRTSSERSEGAAPPCDGCGRCHTLTASALGLAHAAAPSGRLRRSHTPRPTTCNRRLHPRGAAAPAASGASCRGRGGRGRAQHTEAARSAAPSCERVRRAGDEPCRGRLHLSTLAGGTLRARGGPLPQARRARLEIENKSRARMPRIARVPECALDGGPLECPCPSSHSAPTSDGSVDS
jgi:hypothetical protein